MDDQDKKDNESPQVPSPPGQDLPEDLEAAMAWLEQLAARQGAPREELPSIDDDDDLSGEPESLPDWLKDLPDSADAAEFDLDDLDLPIDDSVPEEDLPDWLKVRAASEAIPQAEDGGDGPADAAEELDWLDELTVGSTTEELPTMQWEGGPAGHEAEEAVGDMATAVAEDAVEEMAEDAAAADAPEEEDMLAGTAVGGLAGAAVAAAVMDDDDAEDVGDVENAMAWLEQMAAGEGDAIDEMPTLVSQRADVDGAPEELAIELEPEPVAQVENSPEDMDEAMDWLEQLAADQSTPLEELPSVADRVLASTVMAEAGVQAVDADRVVLPEHLAAAVAHFEMLAAESGIALDEVELVEIEADVELEALLVSLDDHARSSRASGAGRVGGMAVAGATAVGMAALRDDESVDWDELSDEMPEDPDEALAWLERLAEEADLSDQELMAGDEAADAVEEPTRPGIQTADELEDATAAAAAVALEDDFLAEMPEDPDEAMAWLEQLAARQGASLDELPSVDEVRDDVDMPDWLAAQVAAQSLEDEATEAVEEADESGRGVALAAGLAGAAAVGAAILDDDEADEAMLEETAVDETDEDAAVAAGVAGAAAVVGAVVMDDDAEAAPPEETLAWIDDLGEGDVAELLADEEEAAGTVQYDPRVAPQPTSEMATRAELSPGEEAVTAPDADLDARGRAQSMLGSGDIESAADAYQKLIDEGESLPLVIADLETAVVDQPDKPVLNRLLGDAYMRNGQLQKALEAYRQALDHL